MQNTTNKQKSNWWKTWQLSWNGPTGRLYWASNNPWAVARETTPIDPSNSFPTFRPYCPVTVPSDRKYSQRFSWRPCDTSWPQSHSSPYCNACRQRQNKRDDSSVRHRTALPVEHHVVCSLTWTGICQWRRTTRAEDSRRWNPLRPRSLVDHLATDGCIGGSHWSWRFAWTHTVSTGSRSWSRRTEWSESMRSSCRSGPCLCGRLDLGTRADRQVGPAWNRRAWGWRRCGLWRRTGACWGIRSRPILRGEWCLHFRWMICKLEWDCAALSGDGRSPTVLIK